MSEEIELTVTDHNVSTGETIVRPMTEEEVAQWEADKELREAELLALSKKEKAKAALLERLGITAEEAKLLLS
jgi:hypothetical protein